MGEKHTHTNVGVGTNWGKAFLGEEGGGIMPQLDPPLSD